MVKVKIFLGPAGIGVGCKGSTIDGIKYAHEIGLNAMEVEFVRGVKMSTGLAKECGEIAKELGIELSVHAPYFINLCSAERAKVVASQRRILDSVERAHAMGATVVVYHPGYYGKMEKKQAYDAVKEATKEILEKMKEKKIKNVSLGMETTGKHSAFGTLDEIVRMCKQLKGCVPVLDFAQVWFRERNTITFHDPLAAATIFDDQICVFKRGFVEVELTSEKSKGMTYWQPGDSDARHEVALEVDSERFFAHYFSVFQ